MQKTLADALALKPCPFCAGPASMLKSVTFKCYGVECEKCPAQLGVVFDSYGDPEHRYASPEEAAAAWNQRAGEGVKVPAHG